MCALAVRLAVCAVLVCFGSAYAQNQLVPKAGQHHHQFVTKDGKHHHQFVTKAGQHHQQFVTKDGQQESLVFWRPRALQPNDSFFGALADFGRRADEERVLRSRGVIRSFNFQYKSFSYERDFFHLYRGFRLRSFFDGKVDVGLYKHRVFHGLLFGPSGSYLPSTSNRIELMIRWNLNDQK